MSGNQDVATTLSIVGIDYELGELYPNAVGIIVKGDVGEIVAGDRVRIVRVSADEVSFCPCEKLLDAEERFTAAHTAAHYWLAELESLVAERDELKRRMEQGERK